MKKCILFFISLFTLYNTYISTASFTIINQTKKPQTLYIWKHAGVAGAGGSQIRLDEKILQPNDTIHYDSGLHFIESLKVKSHDDPTLEKDLTRYGAGSFGLEIYYDTTQIGNPNATIPVLLAWNKGIPQKLIINENIEGKSVIIREDMYTLLQQIK